MHCLMVKVWCKFEVIEQKPQMLTEFRNHGITFAGGIKTMFCRGGGGEGSIMIYPKMNENFEYSYPLITCSLSFKISGLAG